MQELNLTEVFEYVERNIEVFHRKRIQSLDTLRLSKILKRKNPYLYKAKNILTADEIVRTIVDAHISSSEEGIFGDWLEGLAIFINQKVYNGRKSGIVGVDLEFEKEDKRFIVNIKSGPNWGNNSQIKKMISDFSTAKRTLRTSNAQINVVAVNGCCYGIDNNPDKGDYLKLCGQKFWHFISDNHSLYTELIEPLGFKSKEKNNIYLESYAQKINIFIKEFIIEFCKPNGEIDWVKIVKFNSAERIDCS